MYNKKILELMVKHGLAVKHDSVYKYKYGIEIILPLGFRKWLSDARDICDRETAMFCYCKRLASGLHCSRCSKFNNKVMEKAVLLYAEFKERNHNE